MKSISIKAIGKVQGVWYRASTQKEAIKLGLNGFVRNEPDGSVYIEATGEEEALNTFIKWCKRGPELAHVTEIVVTDILNEYKDGFAIRR